MNAIDAMIVWTPADDDSPNAGRVVVTTIPEADALREYPMSVGACDHNWTETDGAGRMKLLQEYFSQMIEHGIPEADIRVALNAIDDLNIAKLSADVPVTPYTDD